MKWPEGFEWVLPFVEAVDRRYNLKGMPNITFKFDTGYRARGFVGVLPKTGEISRVVVYLDSTDGIDYSKHFILHELAHTKTIRKVLDRKGKLIYACRHDDMFYNVLWSMVKWSKIDQGLSFWIEKEYKPRSAVKMAKIHGIKGAHNA